MTLPILVVIPLAAPEIGLVKSLLAHLATQSVIQHHAVLFVADNGLQADVYQPILDAAKPLFPAGGTLIHAPLPCSTPYPHAHNLRFETALRHISTAIKAPFVFLSPRCVSMRSGWLLELEAEYNAHCRAKPILGQLLTPESHGTAHPLVPSTAVYGHDLPKRIIQRLISQRSVDFEKSCADIFVPLTHSTKLIWNHPLNGTNGMPNPPTVASLVHTSRAKDFSLVVQGKAPREPAPVEAEIVPVAPPKNVAVDANQAAPRDDGPRAGYYHSGDLGDIIYALCAIRLAGGGKLLLGPRSLRTPPPANPMREPVFELFKPLLESQPYITKCEFSERYPGTDAAFDLNTFRANWDDKALRSRVAIHNLAKMHCHILGVDGKFRAQEPWLTVPAPIRTGMFVVHRSSRYRAPDGEFPWTLILKRFSKQLLFVGLASEHADFQRTFDVKIAFWSCSDFLELARVVAGARGFIGNQSFPNALAIACGQRVIQESWPTSPDCVFERHNFLTQPLSESQIVTWEESPIKRSPSESIIEESTHRPILRPINLSIESITKRRRGRPMKRR